MKHALILAGGSGIRLSDQLMHVGQRSFDRRGNDGTFAPWQQAADVVRAASDLLATHGDASGEVRRRRARS